MRPHGNPPSRLEQTIGFAVLLSLLAIVLGVLLRQASFNPAVLVARNAAPLQQSKADAPVAVPWLPPTLKEFGPPESFSADNLYDKIDGKAELYLAAGFARMRCQRFALKESPDDWMEWYVYEMTGVPQAFSVFSTQRRSEGEPLEFTEYAYKTPNALFFASGSNYVEVVASSANEKLMNAASEMAARFVATDDSAGESKALDEMRFLPTENLAPGTQSLQTSDAFGFDQFKNVYTAQYKVGDAELMAFVTSTASASDAAALRDAYLAFLIANGGKAIEVPSGIGKAIEIMGTVELVFSRGHFVAGVHAAPALPAAEQLARRLQEKLPAQ